MARTTIKDIARECGVSLSTVSLVLNNNPRISSSTREKVLKAVDKHQYQPNAFARSLASQSSRVLSVVVPNLNHVFADVYFGEIVSGIYEEATDQGYKILFDVANQRFVSNSSTSICSNRAGWTACSISAPPFTTPSCLIWSPTPTRWCW
jgi:DNA-binding LacI/PurR family transcriptional regulator